MAAPPARFTAAERRVLDQYVARYAEPEVAYADQLTRRYQAAVVLPSCAERPELLEGLTEALAEVEPGAPTASPEPLPGLLIAVVNARRDAPPDVVEGNAALLRDWRTRARRRTRLAPPEVQTAARAPARAELLEVSGRTGRAVHVLLLDASEEGRRFPLKQGVGLARRIGCDLALGLVRRGGLASRYIGSTDGDVRLPGGYLAALGRSPDAVALLFPFEHIGAEGSAVLEATRLVELSWRYYVLGLAWSGSPFAYHSVGSCLAVEVTAYARARGFPRREAAEDFHLLAKLAKLGELDVLAAPVVHIAARRSGRVPFGTGPAVERVLRGRGAEDAAKCGDDFLLHDPRVFLGLRWLSRFVGRLAEGVEEGRDTVPDALPPPVREVLGAEADRWRATLAPRLSSCPSSAHRRHRVAEGFDALATLQAVHALRDAGLPPVPWRRALAEAPFFPASVAGSVADVLAAARELEAKLPGRRGLRSPRPSRA